MLNPKSLSDLLGKDLTGWTVTKGFLFERLGGVFGGSPALVRLVEHSPRSFFVVDETLKDKVLGELPGSAASFGEREVFLLFHPKNMIAICVDGLTEGSWSGWHQEAYPVLSKEVFERLSQQKPSLFSWLERQRCTR